MSLKKLVDLDLLSRFLDKVKALIPSAAANAPQMDGTAAVGTSEKYAREDHRHPKDTSLFSLTMDGTRILSGADLNDYKTPGNYYCDASTIAATLLNCPIAVEFKMVVICNKKPLYDACTQIIFPSYVSPHIVSVTSGGIESGIFYRVYKKYVWEDWIGVNNRYILTSNEDIDNCMNPGIYHCKSREVANTILNGPAVDAVFSVLVMEGVYGRTCQIGFVPSAGSIYFRFYNNGVWTTWYDIRDAATVNGHTVESDVPANAVFTDTISSAYCNTASDVQVKKALCSNFVLQDPSCFQIIFTENNTYEGIIYLNINQTGNNQIYINGQPSGASNYTLPAGAYFVYYSGGCYYINTDGSLPVNDLGVVTCYSAGDSDYKEIIVSKKLSSYETQTNGKNFLFYIHFINANTYVGPLHIRLRYNFSGTASDLYINGEISSASNYTLPAGTYPIYKSGTKYDIRTDGKIPINISGNAATVNGHTVLSDVPANAVFTDTTYTPASAAPLMDGTTAVGTSEKYAREDHVHPRDNTRFSLLGSGTEISSGDDLNDYKTPGNYMCYTVAIASSVIHTPSTISGFKLAVIQVATAQRFFQIAFFNPLSIRTHPIRIRTYNGSTWSDWFSIRDSVTVNGHTVESDVPANIFESKDASEDGTDLSLITTGEKYKWNSAYFDVGRQDLTFVQGNIASGKNSTTNNAICIRTNDYYPINDPGYGFDIDIPDGYRIYSYFYDSSKTYLDFVTWMTGYKKYENGTDIPAGAYYVRFVCSLVENTNLTPSSLPRTIYFRKRLYKE